MTIRTSEPKFLIKTQEFIVRDCLHIYFCDYEFGRNFSQSGLQNHIVRAMHTIRRTRLYRSGLYDDGFQIAEHINQMFHNKSLIPKFIYNILYFGIIE